MRFFTRILLAGLALLLIGGALAEGFSLPTHTTVIEAGAFQNDAKLTGALAIPEGVTEIGAYAFAGCTGFTGTPEIPDSVTRIGAHAFDGCTGLSGRVRLSEGVAVDETAFANCPDLTVVSGGTRVTLLYDQGDVKKDPFNGPPFRAANAFCQARGWSFSSAATGYEIPDDLATANDVVIVVGFGYAEALSDAMNRHPGVKFIGLDITKDELPAPAGNVWLASYRNDIAGFLAGYAAVKLGYRHLGFMGGVEVPAVVQYGQGYVRGADVAARQLGVGNDVIVEYGYAGQFYGDEALTRRVDRWYGGLGAEVVFACGGSLCDSVRDAAVANGGKIIGVDKDQSGELGENITVTSAMKSLDVSVHHALELYADGRWTELGGRAEVLGLVSAEPSENFVQLPTTTRFGSGFSQDDYRTLVGRLFSGDLTVDIDSDVEIEVRDPDRVKRYAVITGSMAQSSAEFLAAMNLLSKYGGEVIAHETYPEKFYEEADRTTEIIAGYANDPTVRGVVVCQAVPGTVEGFRQVRAQRPDILLMAGEPQEDLGEITEAADLVVVSDFVARGYLMLRTAKEKLGCDTFVHISFPRHLAIETIARRLRVMRAAAEDLGMQLVELSAIDPAGEKGLEAAQDYITQTAPQWIQTYGPKTAFFTTNDGLVAPLLTQLVAHGGCFVESDMPDTALGYPEALDLDIQDPRDTLSAVEAALNLQDASGRFGTWAYPYTFTLINGFVDRAMRVVDEGADLLSLPGLSDALEAYSPGAGWNGSRYVDADGKSYLNCLMLYQDTYIMGNPGYYAGNTEIVVPEKYFSIR